MRPPRAPQPSEVLGVRIQDPPACLPALVSCPDPASPSGPTSIFHLPLPGWSPTPGITAGSPGTMALLCSPLPTPRGYPVRPSAGLAVPAAQGTLPNRAGRPLVQGRVLRGTAVNPHPPRRSDLTSWSSRKDSAQHGYLRISVPADGTQMRVGPAPAEPPRDKRARENETETECARETESVCE